jgi:hypothetical protein
VSRPCDVNPRDSPSVQLTGGGRKRAANNRERAISAPVKTEDGLGED